MLMRPVFNSLLLNNNTFKCHFKELLPINYILLNTLLTEHYLFMETCVAESRICVNTIQYSFLMEAH